MACGAATQALKRSAGAGLKREEHTPVHCRMEVLQQIQEGFFTDGRYRKLGRFKNQIIWTASAISGVLSFSFAFCAE